MEHAPRRNRKAIHHRRTRMNPYLLDDIAFTRADIEMARTENDAASAA